MNVQGLLRNWRYSEWWVSVYRDKIFARFFCKNKGTYVLDEDWDNLIILDACRYDMFKMHNQIKGKLEYRISKGSYTVEFLDENFNKYPHKVKLNDIVYVTANPFVSKLFHGKFHRIYSTWDYGWDDKLNTVPPENVVEDALQAKRKYPKKRLVIHFMQPHYPYLNSKVQKELGFQRLREKALTNIDVLSQDRAALFNNPWWLVSKGLLDIEKVLKAYKENLKIVLLHTKHLINRISGKTVVTSDHGNMLGEIPHKLLYPFKTYGHPHRLYVEPLVKVPWLVINRRKENKQKPKKK